MGWTYSFLILCPPDSVPKPREAPGATPFLRFFQGGGSGCQTLPIPQSLAGGMQVWSRGLGGKTKTLEGSGAFSRALYLPRLCRALGVKR